MGNTFTSGGGLGRAEMRGAAQLRRTLKEAGEDLSDLKESNRKAAAIVEEGTVGLVPVDSGQLASTIRSTGTVSAGVVRVGNASVPYAGPIHWGWPKRNIKANTFAADAATLTRPKWEAIYVDAVEKAIARIKGL